MDGEVGGKYTHGRGLTFCPKFCFSEYEKVSGDRTCGMIRFTAMKTTVLYSLLTILKNFMCFLSDTLYEFNFFNVIIPKQYSSFSGVWNSVNSLTSRKYFLK